MADGSMADDADAMAVVREVDDVETLKALSDPLRLAILRTMMSDVRGSHRVKDIAQLLDQPPTRLYRHIKVLEAAGLIKVTQTRMVSGIQESQYQVAQFALRLSRDLLAAPGNAGELADAFAVALNDFRDRLVRDIISGRFQPEPEPEAAEKPDPLGPMVVALDHAAVAGAGHRVPVPPVRADGGVQPPRRRGERRRAGRVPADVLGAQGAHRGVARLGSVRTCR